MAIPMPYRRNFETMLRAARTGDLALLECTDAKTEEPRYVICAIGRSADGAYLMTPFGHLHDGDPYQTYLPPVTEPQPDG